MFVYTIGDIIEIIVIALIIVIVVIWFICSLIKKIINKFFKKNCYECKHWYLYNVSSVGGIDWHKCKKNCFEEAIRGEFNDSEHYEKCSEFERKES